MVSKLHHQIQYAFSYSSYIEFIIVISKALHIPRRETKTVCKTVYLNSRSFIAEIYLEKASNGLIEGTITEPLHRARKSGLEEAVNRPKLAFAVSPKYLSNETKIYIFITRIPRVVYLIFWDFSKILFFPLLVGIYRHPL